MISSSLKEALAEAKKQTVTTVITIETDLYKGVPGYAWWEVAISEVSEIETVKEAYKDYVEKQEETKVFFVETSTEIKNNLKQS